METDRVLPVQHIRKLINDGRIRPHQSPSSTTMASISSDQIQPASLDLSLYTTIHEVQGGFLPTDNTSMVQFLNEYTIKEIDLSSGYQASLLVGHVYIARCREWFNFSAGNILTGNILVKLNSKSTTGRLGISTRVVTEFNHSMFNNYDYINDAYSGDIYLIITPKLFNVVVKYGDKLHQARFVLMTSDPYTPHGLPVGVDLRGEKESDIIGYESIKTDGYIMLDKKGIYDSSKFWRPIYACNKLVMSPDHMYFLASKANISIHPDSCGELTSLDGSSSEFSLLHSGFFDPGYGYEIDGARASFEIIPHKPMVIEHGQEVARLNFEHMYEEPESLYGSSIGSNYHGKLVSLAKQFK